MLGFQKFIYFQNMLVQVWNVSPRESLVLLAVEMFHVETKTYHCEWMIPSPERNLAPHYPFIPDKRQKIPFQSKRDSLLKCLDFMQLHETKTNTKIDTKTDTKTNTKIATKNKTKNNHLTLIVSYRELMERKQVEEPDLSDVLNSPSKLKLATLRENSRNLLLFLKELQVIGPLPVSLFCQASPIWLGEKAKQTKISHNMSHEMSMLYSHYDAASCHQVNIQYDDKIHPLSSRHCTHILYSLMPKKFCVGAISLYPCIPPFDRQGKDALTFLKFLHSKCRSEASVLGKLQGGLQYLFDPTNETHDISWISQWVIKKCQTCYTHLRYVE
jgi:hypothetical protein